MSFKVREARANDKEPLMSFIKDVWGGHDYIPQVWDDWIADRSAKMFVVEHEGRAVAVNRVRFLEDGSAWFEGVRVHPDFRGKGVATMLGDNAMEVAARRGAGVFRLTSGSRNKTAHRQIARMNFEEVGRVSVYDPRKGSRFREQDGPRLAEAGETDRVEEAIKSSVEFKLGRGVMWDGFAATSLTREVIAKRVEEESAYWFDGAVAIARPGREGRNVWNQVCFVCGEPARALKLVKHVFAVGGSVDWRLAFVPQGSPIVGALRRAGLKRSFSLILFQHTAVKG